MGWIDSSRLLVNHYTYEFFPPTPFRGPTPPLTVYSGCTIVGPSGTVLAAPPLPELRSIQPLTSDTVYEPNQNVIYSLVTGQPIWTNPYPQDPDSSGYLPGSPGSLSLGFADLERIGAVSGAYVVYLSKGQVIAVQY